MMHTSVQTHTHAHTFKASKSASERTISFFQAICGMTMSLGCRLNTHRYGDGAWAVSKVAEMIYKEVHPSWMAMSGEQTPK